MSSLTISAIVLGCIVAGILLGVFLRAVLPEQHLSPESKDVIKLGMGLNGTMTVLMLGLAVRRASLPFTVWWPTW